MKITTTTTTTNARVMRVFVLLAGHRIEASAHYLQMRMKIYDSNCIKYAFWSIFYVCVFCHRQLMLIRFICAPLDNTIYIQIYIFVSTVRLHRLAGHSDARSHVVDWKASKLTLASWT